MQPEPPIRGAIMLARAGPNFECLLACREWHALELARLYQRIANPGGLRLGSDVFEHPRFTSWKIPKKVLPHPWELLQTA